MWISITESERENTSNHNETELIKGSRSILNLNYSFPTKVIFTSAMLFTFLVSVVGNSLVIYVVTKHHSMRTSTNCLIMNLAICDLLITLIQTPSFISQLYIGDTWFGGTVGIAACITISYGGNLLLYCSVVNLVAIAIDRFLAVTRPLTYKLSSKWVVKLGIPVIWLTSALLSINSALVAKISNDGTPKCITYEYNSTEDYMSAFGLGGSLVILIVLYSIICYRLWRRKIPGEVSSNQHALATRTARKVTVLMVSVVLVFVVSWAPAYFITLNSIYISVMQYPFLIIFTYWLILNSSACNPCLYFVFIESFREGLKTACLRCRPPELRMCQERQYEMEEPMRNRQTLNNFTQQETSIKLTAYSTVNHTVAPL
ncbi:hypothetical protein OS493_023556 [Desmophyllum pertusum]|uniref:G-protein coupled receptors family 1 profile domain-containing protein n=1 Tax=Desmophyllum pertusum TaxID=174260 RepID=A0A9W9ZDR2_9CNID|nr:hypothetical protein OS493_023556 [Desmophyllum pertusum]